MTQAKLVPVRTPRDPAGVVLLLHGGAGRASDPMVSPTQLSVLRMIPIARRIARAGRGRLEVHRLLNSSRGWDTTNTPVRDVAWALEQLDTTGRDLPVALVGHSLGGRAALLSASMPSVRSVVALNPWIHPTDAVDARGRDVLVVHGLQDRIAPAARARALAARMARTTDVAFREIPGGRHAMLRHAGEFERPAVEFVVRTLLGEPRAATRP